MHPLNSKGFDAWAGTYDQSIGRDPKGYPFEGYDDVLAKVCSLAGDCRGKRVLDLGVGTGALSLQLARSGAWVTGIDFSQHMLTIARSKMPQATFICADLAQGLPEQVKRTTFDAVVSSYALHHLDERGKLRILQEAMVCLVPAGRLIVADIMFRTADDREACRLRSGNRWDGSEHYSTADALLPALAQAGLVASYEQVSCCAGALLMQKASGTAMNESEQKG